MAKRNVDVVAEQYYKPHLQGAFKNEPRYDRTRVIQSLFTRIITETALNRFTWSGLPESVDPRYLELSLFTTGTVVFYKDIDYGFLALQGGGVREWNMYNNPKAFRVWGNAMINKTISAKECVPIYNNYLRSPDIDIVEVYAYKLAEVDTTIEVNTRNMRIPKVFVAPDGQRLSVENFQRQVDTGEPVLVVTQGMSPNDNVTAHDIGIDPRNVESLLMARSRHWADCMTMLGVNNSNQDKKERLVSGEVESNNQQVLASRAVALNARQEACRLINKKYNLNVSVDFNLDVEALLPVNAEEWRNDDAGDDDAERRTDDNG